jgi:hypothetical protein
VTGIRLASALVGGAPLFLLAARGLLKGDLTAGVMVSTATVAAILIGEYSAARPGRSRHRHRCRHRDSGHLPDGR